ncbi:MAG: sugar kinase [Thermotogae bacterium]|nr:MAG: sugar kinase [Thermotogota bacterium]
MISVVGDYMKKAVGMGEIMIQMNPTGKGALKYQTVFERHVAGSEANIIIQMQRLGIQTSFITSVGDDQFGEIISSTLRAEGTNTSGVKVDPDHPTGIYFVQRSYPVPNKTKVFYYRKGSAASFLSSEDINESLFENTDLFLVSGITPALSEKCMNAALKAIEICERKRIKIAFDTNIRVNLLQNAQKALEVLSVFIQKAQILFTGTGDLSFLFGSDFTDNIKSMSKIAKNAELLVIKKGEEGALCLDLSSGKKFEHPSYPVEVIDELGAGDAFDGAFLAGILKGHSIEQNLKYGCAAGAMTVSLKGDIEPLPSWKDLELFIETFETNDEKLLR